MKIRTKAAVMGCAAVLAAGLSAGTAGAEEARCTTSAPVHLSDPGLWSYTYQVTWCVEEGKITSITPHVTHDEDTSKCVWVGSVEESLTPVPDGSGAWYTFNMAEFSCKDAVGKQSSVNPWAVITIRLDGTSDVPRKGIGDVIVD
jgi:hypothetical protein